MGYAVPVWGSLTVVVPAHTRAAGNNIVVLVLTLTHRQNRVRGYRRTQAPITLEWKNTHEEKQSDTNQ